MGVAYSPNSREQTCRIARADLYRLRGVLRGLKHVWRKHSSVAEINVACFRAFRYASGRLHVCVLLLACFMPYSALAIYHFALLG